MGRKENFLRSVKYQLIALMPTIIGLCILLIGFYVLFIDAILNINEAVSQHGIEWITENEDTAIKRFTYNLSPFIGVFLMVVGYMIHKIGRWFVYQKMKVKEPDNYSDEEEPELISNTDQS
jgi:hypothetical protein